MPSVQQFLTEGLKEGFAGKTVFHPVKRGGFELQSSHFEKDGNTYHDEWDADRSGGGQELVKVGSTTYTRVYAGGTISVAALKQLGVTKSEVIGYLIACLNKADTRTRLYENYGPKRTGDWSYQYTILEKNNQIPITVGKEEVFYRNVLVFSHIFVLCPIE